MQQRNPHKKKQRIGVVTSDKMDKTITVKVERVFKHKLYFRSVRASKTFKVHDEKNEAKEGDVVKIIETRPLSKTKRWRLAGIVQKKKE